MSSVERKEVYEVLRGANNNAGGRYEYLMLSKVALKLLQRPEIADFKLSTNSKKFGKFDDGIAEVAFESGRIETWAFQLKHSTNGEVIKTHHLVADKGPFSLKMYLNDYHNPDQVYPANTKFVLYTNKKLEGVESLQLNGNVYTLTSVESPATCPLEDTSEDRSVYQFVNEKVKNGEQIKNKDEMFFQNFYLFVGQKNVEEIDREVSQFFAGTVREDKYKKFFETWWEKNFKEKFEQDSGQSIEEKDENEIGKGREKQEKKEFKHKLYKEDIERELARIVLEPHVRPIENE